MRFLLVAIMLLVTTNVYASSDSDIYNAGYRDGHAYGKSFPIRPMRRIAPMRRFNESDTDYYLRGVFDGRNR